jgi:hypothetical protein
MGDNMVIYVKNDEHRDELQKRYPDVKADFINMKGTGMADILPMVCATIDGVETCENGERYIEEFSKRLK